MLASTSSHYATWGLIAATVAAVFWAVSVVLYRRVGRVMPPVMLNMTKGLIAVVILSAVLVVDWFAFGNQPWSMSWGKLALMAFSGVVGIGLGDTLFFAGLNRMGARRMLLLFTINPVITVLIAWALMHEPLSGLQLAGIALTCGGVAWVIAERNTAQSDGHVDLLGVIYGIGAATCQASGYLLSRHILLPGGMTPAASAWLRLFAGSLILVAFLPMDRWLKNSGGQDHHHPAHPSKTQTRIMFFVALLLGTVMGIWLMQISAKHADKAGIAATLLSTSPLFVLPIVAMLGERISPRAVLGALITITGVAMLFVFSA
ncbi:MAG: DMT family transporter [Phycisphaeraceae bacterium]|nr:DMT family transporter [Phycisphaeraceae bacterium]